VRIFGFYLNLTVKKKKGADHVCKILLTNVSQPFNVCRLHSDNGPCFWAINWLEAEAALNIQIISSSALHPSRREHIERTVGIVKTMLKKMLAIQTALDWEYLLFFISKIMNNSILPKTSFKPKSMVLGTDNPSFAFLDTEKLAPLHFMVKNNQQHITKLTTELNEMTRQATEHLL
jgi:transposase InsO family protein